MEHLMVGFVWVGCSDRWRVPSIHHSQFSVHCCGRRLRHPARGLSEKQLKLLFHRFNRTLVVGFMGVAAIFRQRRHARDTPFFRHELNGIGISRGTSYLRNDTHSDSGRDSAACTKRAGTHNAEDGRAAPSGGGVSIGTVECPVERTVPAGTDEGRANLVGGCLSRVSQTSKSVTRRATDPLGQRTSHHQERAINRRVYAS